MNIIRNILETIRIMFNPKIKKDIKEGLNESINSCIKEDDVNL